MRPRVQVLSVIVPVDFALERATHSVVKVHPDSCTEGGW